ncbi:MAG TPA: TIGR03620 family F420-dependent LLM class oxidoreductase [Iamia sp.]|nr:TIGR03620 family F420-dependent LLM class oxidoreductase [Iamia sp.]
MIDVGAWRRRLGPLGVWTSTDRLPVAEARALVAEVEGLGFGAVWLPETTGRDPFAHIAHLADHTTDLVLATGIANIHHRHPGAMRQAADTLAEQSGGRFVLGLGVSHAAMVEGVRGLSYGSPLATMRAYLDGIEEAPRTAPAPAVAAPRLVGALGPKMIALAGERADGVHPYWTTPEHTARARAILGPDKLLCVEQKVVLTTDAVAARATARKALGHYVRLPSYRSSWLRLGFDEGEVDGLADPFVDGLVAWGDADAVRARIDAHLEAGADHVCIQPMTPDHPLRLDGDALRALAPAPLPAR